MVTFGFMPSSSSRVVQTAANPKPLLILAIRPGCQMEEGLVAAEAEQEKRPLATWQVRLALANKRFLSLLLTGTALTQYPLVSSAPAS